MIWILTKKTETKPKKKTDEKNGKIEYNGTYRIRKTQKYIFISKGYTLNGLTIIQANNIIKEKNKHNAIIREDWLCNMQNETINYKDRTCSLCGEIVVIIEKVRDEIFFLIFW